ncbi:helix-turn-helix domain-containing protein [Pseudonocardia humida]|uniref:Helix-turn-helix transcriptional regulator n=1 Tax=Pseudonocardia humida TaxID=2800819 RepID=A0ABT1A357_9PSEU|nr:helix-turn-helix transcriptional regulator [Pseudonocardia humida]MCO1657428.1 helix-turn-helix transcriptional regulator [Pseudonocardia humida]
MRGAGDGMRIGERVAFYRGRRGISQRMLGDLVGRSEDWVSKIERGVRDIRRVDVVAELAKALRVELGDLLGQPVLMEDERQDDDVPAIRDALMTPSRLSRTLFRRSTSQRAISPDQGERLAEHAWLNYQQGRIGRVIAELPRLISAGQELEDAATPQNRQGWAVSARVHHLAATTLSKIGEGDLAWIAAERAMYAADQADHPLVLASAARAGTHALLASGRFDDAVELGNTAAEWMRPQLVNNDPAALSLLGMLRLRTAVAAARRRDRAASTELIRRAQRAAELLGHDGDHWQTQFGPTNVELHRISTALDLGDVDYVVRHGPDVTASNLPAERQVSHMIDVARALSLVARDDQATELLLGAEQLAPHLVRHNPIVREMVKAMYRRSAAARTSSSVPLSALAERCRAVR